MRSRVSERKVSAPRLVKFLVATGIFLPLVLVLLPTLLELAGADGDFLLGATYLTWCIPVAWVALLVGDFLSSRRQGSLIRCARLLALAFLAIGLFVAAQYLVVWLRISTGLAV